MCLLRFGLLAVQAPHRCTLSPAPCDLHAVRRRGRCEGGHLCPERQIKIHVLEIDGGCSASSSHPKEAVYLHGEARGLAQNCLLHGASRPLALWDEQS